MNSKTFGIYLMASTALAVTGTLLATPALAQQSDASQPPALAPSLVPASVDQIQSITVVGTQRLEADTVRSYIRLRPGQPWAQASADQALKDLYATELFADVAIRNNSGAVVIEVKENPVVNRIILEGNKRLKNDKIEPEIKLAPRQIFSRSKVRTDVARIVELYKRQGRFAATVEPKMVQLDQNRVDIVFEITEGPKSKVQQINIIGNDKFSDGQLRGEMVTKQARFTRFFSSATSYDPDRLAFDQQKLRQFYLTQGYADFRVVSAVAELTPDKQDFIITYVVEEGDRFARVVANGHHEDLRRGDDDDLGADANNGGELVGDAGRGERGVARADHDADPVREGEVALNLEIVTAHRRQPLQHGGDRRGVDGRAADLEHL